MRNLSLNKILILVVVLVLVINAVIIANYMLNRKGSGISMGMNSGSAAFMFTQPVTAFNGQVESMSGDNLNVKVSYIGADGTTETSNITVGLDNKTVVTKNSAAIPYSLKTIPTTATALTASKNDIQAGDMISVTTKEDLRMLKGNSVTATGIVILPKSQQLNGTVVSKNGPTVTVKGIVVVENAATTANPSSIKQETFTVNTTSDTEIVRLAPPSPTGGSKAEKISVGELKSDESVVVYFTPNGGSTNVSALLIQTQSPVSAAPPTASSSATPATTVSPTGRAGAAN